MSGMICRVDAVREVFDVAWSPGCQRTFVAATGNGAVHRVDTRAIGATQILYNRQSPSSTPSPGDREVPEPDEDSCAIVRLAFNPSNPHLLATLQLNSSTIRILDTRKPGVFSAELNGHGGYVNGIAWRGCSDANKAGEARGATLATVSDDCQVLLWDAAQIDTIDTQAHTPTDPKGKGRLWDGRPSAVCEVPYPVENVAWGVDNDYLAVTMGSRIRCMRL